MLFPRTGVFHDDFRHLSCISININLRKKKIFDSISLKDFPGENMSDLAIIALKCIKKINTGYDIDIKISLSFLKKVETIFSSYFSRNIHNELSIVKRLEMKYALKDSKLLKVNPDYPTLDPIRLCGFIKEEYSVLFIEQDWPTTESSLSAANNSLVDSEKTGNQNVNSRGSIHISCGSNIYFIGNLVCTQFNSTKKMKPVVTINKEANVSSKKENSTPRSKVDWKYIYLADKNKNNYGPIRIVLEVL